MRQQMTNGLQQDTRGHEIFDGHASRTFQAMGKHQEAHSAEARSTQLRMKAISSRQSVIIRRENRRRNDVGARPPRSGARTDPLKARAQGSCPLFIHSQEFMVLATQRRGQTRNRNSLCRRQCPCIVPPPSSCAKTHGIVSNSMSASIALSLRGELRCPWWDHTHIISAQANHPTQLCS